MVLRLHLSGPTGATPRYALWLSRVWGVALVGGDRLAGTPGSRVSLGRVVHISVPYLQTDSEDQIQGGSVGDRRRGTGSPNDPLPLRKWVSGSCFLFAACGRRDGPGLGIVE